MFGVQILARAAYLLTYFEKNKQTQYINKYCLNKSYTMLKQVWLTLSFQINCAIISWLQYIVYKYIDYIPS